MCFWRAVLRKFRKIFFVVENFAKNLRKMKGVCESHYAQNVCGVCVSVIDLGPVLSLHAHEVSPVLLPSFIFFSRFSDFCEFCCAIFVVSVSLILFVILDLG